MWCPRLDHFHVLYRAQYLCIRSLGQESSKRGDSQERDQNRHMQV